MTITIIIHQTLDFSEIAHRNPFDSLVKIWQTIAELEYSQHTTLQIALAFTVFVEKSYE